MCAPSQFCFPICCLWLLRARVFCWSSVGWTNSTATRMPLMKLSPAQRARDRSDFASSLQYMSSSALLIMTTITLPTPHHIVTTIALHSNPSSQERPTPVLRPNAAVTLQAVTTAVGVDMIILVPKPQTPQTTPSTRRGHADTDTDSSGRGRVRRPATSTREQLAMQVPVPVPVPVRPTPHNVVIIPVTVTARPMPHIIIVIIIIMHMGLLLITGGIDTPVTPLAQPAAPAARARGERIVIIVANRPASYSEGRAIGPRRIRTRRRTGRRTRRRPVSRSRLRYRCRRLPSLPSRLRQNRVL